MRSSFRCLNAYSCSVCHLNTTFLHVSSLSRSPRAHLSRGGDVKVYVLDINQQSLPTPFTLFLCLFLSYSPFTCISFHKFFRQLRILTLFSQSFLPHWSFQLLYLFLKVSLNGFGDQRVCRALRPVSGEEGILEMEVPLAAAYWGQHISLAWTSLRRVVGLARPNQSAGRA